MEWLSELIEDTATVDKIKAELPKYFIPKEKYNGKVEELKVAQETIAQREIDIQGLKKADPEELKLLKDKHEAEKVEWENKVKDTSMKAALKMQLNGKVHDVDVAMGLLDTAKITLDDVGNIKGGFEEQLKGLQENKAYLFKTEPTAPITGVKPIDGTPVAKDGGFKFNFTPIRKPKEE